MLGDEILLFQTTVTIDDKTRILMPSKTLVKPKEQLILYDSREGYLSIYSAIEFEERLKYLQNQARREFEKGNFNQKDLYKCQLAFECARVFDKQNVDSARRLLLGKYIMEKFNFDKEVFMEGEYDHINLFDSEESFEKYKQFIKKKIL